MFFDLLNEMGYKLIIDKSALENESITSCLTFVKPGFETEFFAIRGFEPQKKYEVSVPLKNSLYQYRISFTNYDDAVDFLESKFKEYILG
jgi:hypothetical protein